MDHESLAAAYSCRALSLRSEKQGTGFVLGDPQVLEGSSGATGCRSGPDASAPRDLWSRGVLGT